MHKINAAMHSKRAVAASFSFAIAVLQLIYKKHLKHGATEQLSKTTEEK